MDFRHEWKHPLNPVDFQVLRQRLSALFPRDSHAGPDGTYHIRSLYFDDQYDHALRAKLDGVNHREKFRIRLYNGSTSVVRLEKKSRINSLGNKQSANLTQEQAQAIVDGDLEWLSSEANPLLRELYVKMKNDGLRPKTIVDYTREPFVFAPGNVRLTLDWDLRTGLGCTDFLNPNCVTVPALDPMYLLEVKYDCFLPDIVRDAIQLESRQATAFSKYATCRIYG